MTNFTISAGTPARRHLAAVRTPFLERRYLIIPGIRSSRIYVVDTKPDPTKPRFTRSSSRKRSSGRPATRDRTPSTADRRAFTSLPSAVAARMARRDRPACSSWIARHSKWSAAGRSIGAAEEALRFLVEPAARLHGHQRMGAAASIRERYRAGGSPGEQIWPSGSFLGFAGPQKRPDDRSRRKPSDGAGSAPRA